jgi:hypothetical protein
MKLPHRSQCCPVGPRVEEILLNNLASGDVFSLIKEKACLIKEKSLIKNFLESCFLK